MKHFFSLVLALLFFQPLIASQIQAQGSTEGKNPYSRELDESAAPDATATVTAEDELLGNLSLLDGEADKLQASFGVINETGDLVPGALQALKLKPSDKKRLIKLANGSLSQKEQETVVYDKRLLQLLVQLTSPKAVGGSGLTHLRVGDLLRFRQDPRSKETEGADNISQHQYGKAADIIEINKANCTKESFFGGGEDLPPFPVKVAWQGGGPYDPRTSSIGSFDAVARANAFQEILGALPGSSYNGNIQGFEDLLQQLQRRVLALELNLPTQSLDFLLGGDVLATLGQAVLNNELGLPPSAFSGETSEDRLQSVPRSYLEQALLLPRDSLKGNDWNAVFERLGRIKVAYDIDANPEDLLKGDTKSVKTSPYYAYYKEVESAYQLVKGTLDGLKDNKSDAYRQVGALLLADRLHYAKDERSQLIEEAKRGSVKDLSLARLGDIREFPGSLLPIFAPGPESSKSKGEVYLGRQIVDSLNDAPLELDSALKAIVQDFLPILNAGTKKQDLTDQLIKLPTNKLTTLYRQAGAQAMEQVFDVPELSFSELVTQTSTPSQDAFASRLAQRLLEDYANVSVGKFKNGVTVALDSKETDVALSLPDGTTERYKNNGLTYEAYKKMIGDTYMSQDFHDSFRALYHGSQTGLAAFTTDEMYSIITGDVTRAATRAGATWVEEDLGMVPDSFALFFTDATPEERLVNAGVTVLAGELFEAFEIDARGITTGELFKKRLGQALVETRLGLVPGSFVDSIETIKAKNKIFLGNRYDLVFAHPEVIDRIVGVNDGTFKHLLENKQKPEEIALQVGGKPLSALNTNTLEAKLGWDSRYGIDGDMLLRTLESSDGTTKKQGAGGGEVTSMREILALIGSYNSDFFFGYAPETLQKWSTSTADTRNQILVFEGGKKYAARHGFSFENRDDLIETYITGEADKKKEVFNEIKRTLEAPPKTPSAKSIYKQVKASLEDQLLTLGEQLEGLSTSEEKEKAGPLADKRTQIEDKTDKPAQGKEENRLRDLQNDVKELEDLANKLPSNSATNRIKDTIKTASRTLDEQVTILNTPPSTTPLTIGDSDISSFMQGDMALATTVLVAAAQAKQIKFDIDNPYELFRTILIGWSNDPEFERALSEAGTSRYDKVLKDLALTKSDDLLDLALEQITKGVLKEDGSFDPSQSPYAPDFVKLIYAGYFASEEARDTYYYTILDTQIRKNDPSLPVDFALTLMEGGNEDRSRLLYDYLKGHVSDQIIEQLPPELQGPARSFFDSYDPETGEFLSSKDSYVTWASSTLSTSLGFSLPPDTMKLVIQYVSGTFDGSVLAFDAGEGKLGTEDLQDLKPAQMAEFVGRQIGLPTGQFKHYYDQYRQVQSLYKDYKAGNLDVAQAVFALDAILFDGALAELLTSLDDALGLPPGSAQLLIQFATSGNPVYLIQFVIGLVLSSTIECPDYQREAQKNIKKLIRATINQGEMSAALIPSQIITLRPGYLSSLTNTIRKNYFVCTTGSRCGVFARPEYSKQVHIGF